MNLLLKYTTKTLQHIQYSIVIAVLFSINISAQTKVIGKSKILKEADVYFETQDYIKAIEMYKKLLVIEPNNEIANLNSAVSRLKLGQAKDSCMPYIQKLKASKLAEASFYLGQIYHNSLSFDEATEFYNKYKAIAPKYRLVTDTEVDYYLSCSSHAREYMSNPHLSIIKNLGEIVNSAYDDYVPLITVDDSLLYFTSRRESSTGGLKDAYGKYYEDIYVSKKTDKYTWTQPKNLGSKINTNTHDACVSVSFDGNQMMIYRTNPDLVTGDLYLCEADNDGWFESKRFGTEINTPYIETSACFSNDTSVIYFSSNKPGGFGGKDLYRIKKLPNGKWALPMNLGSVINTDKDEDAPFLHPDGTTLYFSSKGHTTMGDYDVFKTNLDPETAIFSIPENLGYPINTVNGDRFFVLNASGSKGYYSSIKEDSYGGTDIYMIDTRFGDNDLVAKHGRVTIGKESSGAKITLIDVDSKKVVGIYLANSKTGKFLMILNPLKAYKAIIEEPTCHNMVMDIEPLANELSEGESTLILSLTKKRVAQ